ncbi:unnamed protein product [Spirodela intermedia]|uniref:Calcium-transporting ATPase n=1 Tax=Spirodela intermedia TaxID=51605 RepID=A0A7I8II19_SPIIN|nr:unnamed protein product [Spirodela intermedia]CAA6657525.1 unnamed protein product [Spirodela intermedia]
MENYLDQTLRGVKSPPTAKLCGVVKNLQQRVRSTANRSKRSEAEAMTSSNRERSSVATEIPKVTLQIAEDISSRYKYSVPEEVEAAGFQICASELGSIVEEKDAKKLKDHGGVEGIAAKLSSSTTRGIADTEDQLRSRQDIYGVNKFTEAEMKSFWVFLWEALQDTTLTILGVCAFVSLVVGIGVEGWPKGAHDGLGIVASILLVVIVTGTSNYRQSLQFRDLDEEKKKISIQATRNGSRQKMSIYDLLPGDIVHLAIGDQVPADGLFVSGFSLLINASSLTGESEPVAVNVDNPFLSSGTKVQDGFGKMLVTTVGMKTQWGKLVAALGEVGDDETPLQVKLNGVAGVIGKIGLFFAVLTFSVLAQALISQKIQDGSVMGWTGDDALEILNYFAIAVTIVVVAKMMNDRALVRHLAACETMGSATCICSDKTGTLTTNRMTVVKACICGSIKEVGDSGEALKARSRFQIPPSKLFCNLSSNFRGGFRAHCKGASEMVLASCEKVIDPAGNSVPLDEATRQHLAQTIESFCSEALRSLCLAYRDMDGSFCVEDQIPQEGFTCIGIVGIKDPVRPGVKESVAVCRSAGITVRMITGDNINTARAIARECGILTEGGVTIEGPEFRRKSAEELTELVPKLQVMARSSPLDKLTLVRHLRTVDNEVVAVTGDGTNDAPALREADIGLAMGISGTEVAKESSDVIILDDNFSTIVTVAKWGRSVYVNIQKFVQFQLTVNVVALVVNFSSACLTGHAPLTAVQLLWVNMIMDTLGALALATEPPQDELMKRTPLGREGSFISSAMWRNIAGQSLYQFIVICYLQTEGKDLFQLSGPDADLTLNTLIFNAFIFCQIFNEISSREMEKIDVLTGLLNNYVFVGVVSCTVAFQIIIVEFLGDFAGTTPLDLSQWLVCVLIGFLGMPIAAAVKLIPVGSKETQPPRQG